MKTVQERFWSKVNKTDTCWLWTAHAVRGGYGQFWDGERLVYAHRLALEWATGPRPPGLEACHSCRSRQCVNPLHLRWDSHAANVADMKKDGTIATGERHGMAKLTATQVLAIRAAVAGGETQRSVAKRYGVSQRLVNHIVHRRIWAHLEAA